MIIEAGDLNVRIDTGTNEPGAVLQRLEGDELRDLVIVGKPVPWPVPLHSLPPGQYRVVEKGACRPWSPEVGCFSAEIGPWTIFIVAASAAVTSTSMGGTK